MTCYKRFMKFIDSACSKFFTGKSVQLEITNTDILRAVAQINQDRFEVPIFLPPQKIIRKVLVLDLDDTLIHSTLKRPHNFDFESKVMLFLFRSYSMENKLHES